MWQTGHIHTYAGKTLQPQNCIIPVALILSQFLPQFQVRLRNLLTPNPFSFWYVILETSTMPGQCSFINLHFSQIDVLELCHVCFWGG